MGRTVSSLALGAFLALNFVLIGCGGDAPSGSDAEGGAPVPSSFTFGDPIDIQVADVGIKVPGPDGFAPGKGLDKTMDQLINARVASVDRLHQYFATEDDVEAFQDGKMRALNRHHQVLSIRKYEQRLFDEAEALKMFAGFKIGMGKVKRLPGERLAELNDTGYVSPKIMPAMDQAFGSNKALLLKLESDGSNSVHYMLLFRGGFGPYRFVLNSVVRLNGKMVNLTTSSNGILPGAWSWAQPSHAAWVQSTQAANR